MQAQPWIWNAVPSRRSRLNAQPLTWTLKSNRVHYGTMGTELSQPMETDLTSIERLLEDRIAYGGTTSKQNVYHILKQWYEAMLVGLWRHAVDATWMSQLQPPPQRMQHCKIIGTRKPYFTMHMEARKIQLDEHKVVPSPLSRRPNSGITWDGLWRHL